MKDLILANTRNTWINSARITYVEAYSPLPYVLFVNRSLQRVPYMQTFKSIASAKNNFTRQFYKGIWVSEEQN